MASNWGIVNRDEIHRFILALKQFQQGTLNESDFTAQRLMHGIYGQRQDDQYMIRVKVPGGILDREQLDCIGDLTEKYSNTEFSNITTRQDIQLHFVELKSIPKILLRLSDVGLTTREACGNTMRNMTACSLAGICPQEHVDIRPLLNKATLHFLRHPLTQHLPRKFKMSFSGCESDCAMGLIHDLAVVAVKKQGEVGFKILVGGGLGHKPREAIVLEAFVEESQVIAVIESIVTLHNRYSDRNKRAKSRLKFLVERFGADVFREKYQQILPSTIKRLKNAEAKQEGIKNNPMRWCNIDFVARKDALEKKTTVLLNIALGDLKPKQIREISQTMGKFNLKNLRTTQGQDLLLVDVKERDRGEVLNRLESFSRKPTEASGNIVACPGSWTCRLGITDSRGMATKIARQMKELKVNVSGCHNSCAQPQISDIGLHGEGRRKFGKLLPYYRLYLGGDGSMNGGFALKGPEIPAVRILSAISTVEERYILDSRDDINFRAWVKSKKAGYFSELLKEFVAVSAEDVPDLLREDADKTDFRVLQLGGGECAGVAEETVSAHLSEIRYEQGFSEIFVRQNELDSALECAENILTLSAKSLLSTKKQKFIDDRLDVALKLNSVFIGYYLGKNSYLALCERLDSLKLEKDKAAVEVFFKALNEWFEIVQEVLDSPIKIKQVNEHILDLTAESAPVQYLKAKQRFNALENGKSLQILFRQLQDANLVFKGLESQGFQLLSLSEKMDEEQTVLHMLKPVNFSKEPKQSEKESLV